MFVYFLWAYQVKLDILLPGNLRWTAENGRIQYGQGQALNRSFFLPLIEQLVICTVHHNMFPDGCFVGW